MVDQNKFLDSTKKVLERRAASICSNPYCKITTSGPTEDGIKAFNVGQAAHIYGANPGSARYLEKMKPEERRDITNGIWLCSTCAKLIDSDEKKYFVDILYKWKKAHEDEVLYKTGTSGWDRKLLEEKLNPIKNISLRALQIAYDKPDLWEFLLTVELLRTLSEKNKKVLNEIESGFTYRKTCIIDEHEFIKWFRCKIFDLASMINLINLLLNSKLSLAWGAPGESGDEEEICKVAEKIDLAYKAMIEWESDLFFTEFPDDLSTIKDKMKGWTNVMFFEMEKIAEEISKILSRVDKEDQKIFQINLVFNPPSNLEEVSNEVFDFFSLND